MLTNKKLSVGMGALAMLLREVQSVNLKNCLGHGGNNADINLSFEVNLEKLIKQASASLPKSEDESVGSEAVITGDDMIGEPPVVIDQPSQLASEQTSIETTTTSEITTANTSSTDNDTVEITVVDDIPANQDTDESSSANNETETGPSEATTSSETAEIIISEES